MTRPAVQHHGASSPLSTKESLDETEAAPTSQEQKRSWYGHIWDGWDKSPDERRLLLKLDLTLLT